MDVKHINYQEVKQLSKRDRDYIGKDVRLAEFIESFPSLEAFDSILENRRNYKTDRKLLVDNLNTQYEQVEASNLSLDNIEKLKSNNCFTLITAHQPSLFTGPLYYIYKILSTIKLSQILNERYSEYSIVPIFIIGAEDHDFEEVNHIKLFGKTIIWNRESEGPVGRLNLDGLDLIYDQVVSIIGEANIASDFFNDLKNFIHNSKNVKDLSFKLVNRLFGKFGLVVASMDNPSLKRKMVPYFEKEILENLSEKTVIPVQKNLASKSYGAQAYVRPINIFYMEDGFRRRIEQNGSNYNVIETKLKFTENELLQELRDNPEKFSPNVVLRPLYQELIFPNLAYIGGGGELAYWMERKQQFKAFDIPFPLLIRRNSAMLIEGFQRKKIQKFGFTTEDIFNSEEELIQSYVINNSGDDSFNYTAEKQEIYKNLQTIAEKAAQVDSTLKQRILAESVKILKSVDHISKKVEKRLKDNHETKINQIKKLKSSLFPNNGLQERNDNVLVYLAKYGEELIDNLLPFMNPLDNEMTVIYID